MMLAALEKWLTTGDGRIGEVQISGSYELRHVDDVGREDLQLCNDANAARQLALYDDAGLYRPLKTAPNLRHGWMLAVPDLAELRRALDFFYPAMLGLLVAWRERRLAVTPLRATLERQSGMYALTKKLTDAQADPMIGGFCDDAHCRKTILWEIAPGVPIRTLPAEKFDPARESFPLLCQEACNLLVAEARNVVKKAAA